MIDVPEPQEPFSLPSPAPILMEAGSSNVEVVTRKAAKGAVALGARQIVVYGCNIGGSVVLARLLPADEFGFYSIVVFALNFLTIFGGTGVASNLIRMPEEPDLREKRAVFLSQEVIVGVIFLAIWLVAPQLGRWYHLGAHGALFFRLIGVSLVFTSLMVIPQVQMERELEFERLAIIEVCQAIVFNLGAILLALRGVGYISFAIALVLRTAVGCVMALSLSPWRMGFELRADRIREHLQFGIALQIGQLVVVARDSLTPIFVGLYLGAADVGYITWAALVAGSSILLIVPLQRLYLPLFARVQNDREGQARLLFRVTWAVNAICAPLTCLTLGLLRPLTSIVFGGKWLLALPLVYCFAFANLFIPTSNVILAALNAIGRSRSTLLFSAVGMLIIWGCGIPLIVRWGIWGFGVATLLTSLLNFALYWGMFKVTGFNPAPCYWPAWPIAGCLFFAAKIACLVYEPQSLYGLTFFALVGFVLYGLSLLVTSKSRLQSFVELLWPNALRRA